MPILHSIEQPNQFQWMIFCPACKCGHGLRVGQPDKPCWSFNGDVNKPTFSPSLLVGGVNWPEKDPTTGDFRRGADGEYLVQPDGRLLGTTDRVCHSFIKDGMIEFLSDCTHSLRGQTVPLEEF